MQINKQTNATDGPRLPKERWIRKRTQGPPCCIYRKGVLNVFETRVCRVGLLHIYVFIFHSQYVLVTPSYLYGFEALLVASLLHMIIRDMIIHTCLLLHLYN